MMDLKELIAASRRYGADPEMVLAGGGNTSVKDDEFLFVKASGHTLASIDESGFVKMRMDGLRAVWQKEYAEDAERREDQVLSDMMSARAEGERERPSVEALLHSLIRHRYVIHLHPCLVNGLTCARRGKEAVTDLFGTRAVWIPLVNPGYILAKTVKEALYAHEMQTGVSPEMIFLQNHGIFVSGDSITEIDTVYEEIMNSLRGALVRVPDLDPVMVDPAREQIVSKALREVGSDGSQIYSFLNRELVGLLQDTASFYPVSSAFTPDHIVYSGFRPLWIPESVFGADDPVSEIVRYAEGFKEEHGVAAKSVAVQRTGVFTYTDKAMLLFLDTVKVSVYTESFGGPLFMDDDQIDFIRNWEVEKYRAAVLNS